MKKIFILIVGVFISMLSLTINASTNLITHNVEVIKDIDLTSYQVNLHNKKDLILPLNIELELLNQLAEFDLGKFLLLNKGLNGYWTSYLILYGLNKKDLSPLENWVLHSALLLKLLKN
ncbi:MAG: hypothetical protein RCG15_07740 [Candidatus Rickettsia vulgarisii]